MPLFRVFGITVFVHWAWLVVAVIEVRYRSDAYNHLFWNVLEYLSLFGIVLLHEFGHSLACRSVGGQADRILLWPLGGAAFVDPPQRPWPVLWSIAAGPLVNVALIPVTLAVLYAAPLLFPQAPPDLGFYLETMALINLGLLLFNLLPIYPLDGGQILRALLWFAMGPHRSLSIAASIGLIASVVGFVAALTAGEWWLMLIAIFTIMTCSGGLMVARTMARVARAPRYPNVICPNCGEHAPQLEIWNCKCGKPLDVFACRGQCPKCGRVHEKMLCPLCSKYAPLVAWYVPSAMGLEASGQPVAADDRDSANGLDAAKPRAFPG